jgi:branched-chain amino acid transport system permease protein
MTTVWAGMSSGAIYALVAVAYNLVYIGSATFNFAHANLMTLGVFLAYWGLVQIHWPVVAILVVSALIVGAVAVLEERVAIRPVHEIHGHLVTTVGAATLITGAIEVLWGQEALKVPAFFSDRPLKVLGGAVLPGDLIIIGIALAATLVFALVSRFTMVGLAALAVSEDREAALLRGINGRRVQLTVFALSGLLAGALGLFLGPKTFASYGLANSLALIGFVALALGGFGSIVGAAVGAFVIGLAQSFTARYIGGNYENLAIFVLLLLVLLALPTGLFGTRRERVV